MKTSSPPRVSLLPGSLPGITLLELTVVLSVLLALISVLFIGARAWKSGSDRAGCIMTVRNVQAAVRAYQNFYGFRPGQAPAETNGSSDIALHLKERGYVAPECYLQLTGIKPCAGGGSYTRLAADTFPEVGELYAECSLAVSSHNPGDHAEW